MRTKSLTRQRVTAVVAAGASLTMFGALTAAPAQAYGSLGCRWSSTTVQLRAPSPYLSYPAWSNAAASWNNAAVDARYAVNGSTYNLTGLNENRGNTVSWTGVTRAAGTVQSFPPCSGGRWTSGGMEVVLNWSLVSGYSVAKRQGVAAHELGHALVLAHNSASTGILMYPTDARTVTSPASDDKAGINAYY